MAGSGGGIEEQYRMDRYEIRAKSLLQASGFGLPINEALPLLDAECSLKSPKLTMDRCMVLHAIINVAFRWDRKKAQAWLESEGLIDSLTSGEHAFLFHKKGEAEDFRERVEALNALMWALGKVETLDFRFECPDDLVTRLPDLRRLENSSRFRAHYQSRNIDEVAGQSDLYYCLDWASLSLSKKGRHFPGNVSVYWITERRRALDWLLYDRDWSDLTRWVKPACFADYLD